VLRRSVRTIGVIGAILLGVGLGPCAAIRAQGAAPDPLRRALVSAVLERMGPSAEVVVGAINPSWDGPFTRVAIDPSARIGGPVAITIFTGPAASVRVSAVVKVVVDYVVAGRPVPGGQVLVAADVTAVRGVVAQVPFRRLPTLAEVVGARGLRPLAPGEIIQPSFVAAIPLVRAGQTVTARARIGSVEASLTFTAVDGGAPGDVIRIVNPDTRRTLRARVVSAGLVEVINVQ
jgi:flagella basal body P-ring formation protein FlgA